jgi:hypothetical protein
MLCVEEIHPLLSRTCEAFSLLQVLGNCKIERFIEMLSIRSLINFLSGGFENFAKNLSSPSDSLGRSEVYDPHQRLFMFAFLFILPTKWLMGIFG